jgi:hypothetical protein
MSASSIASRLLVSPFLLALTTACADSAVGPSTSAGGASARARQQAAGTVDITGTWSFHEDATLLLYHFGGRGTKAFRCSTDGTYTFVQTGKTFTGSYDQTGTCTAADGTTVPNDFTDIGVEGTVQGHHVSFVTADGCTLQGGLRGPTLSVMGGASRCGGPKFGGTYRAAWTATR